MSSRFASSLSARLFLKEGDKMFDEQALEKLSRQDKIELIVSMEKKKQEKIKDDYLAYLDAAHYGFVVGKHTRYLNEKLWEFLNGSKKILCLSMPPQSGKKIRDSEPVLTTKGWKRHGDLRVGDEVFGRYGQPVKVLAELNHSIFPDCNLEVEFTDGEIIKVHPQHEWTVIKDRQREMTLETQQIMTDNYIYGNMGHRGSRCRYQVDTNQTVDFEEKTLEIHPYLLGLWLGDGRTSVPEITHHPSDMESINKIVRLGYNITSVGEHNTTGVLTTRFWGDTYQKFKKLDLAHPNGKIKYIPSDYKFSSKEQRLELLAGLIDSDGSVHQKTGRVTFSNINKKLIDDVSEITRSLGFRTTISEREPETSSSGIIGRHKIYQLTFNPYLDIPTALPRKKITNFKPLQKRRGIVSIRPCIPEKGKCISVDGGIYLVGKHLIPTHNSYFTSESLPAYFLMKNPRKKVIVASYNQNFAITFGKKNKDKVSALGHNFNVELDPVGKSSERWYIKDFGGTMLSVGIMGGITGNGADLVIIDDPTATREEANSATIQDKIWAEFYSSVNSRLSATGKIIVILTRWHERDLIGRITTELPPDKYEVINIPLEAGENDILGREVGDSLFPEIGKDKAWMQELKSMYVGKEGLQAWESLYQGNPNILAGNLIKTEWLQFYDKNILPQFLPQKIMTVDAAMKEGKDTDFSVIQVWGKLNGKYYLIDQFRKRVNYPELELAVTGMFSKHKPSAIYIEDKVNGTAVIQTLRRNTGLPVIALKAKGTKMSRVQSILGVLESGKVHLPNNVDWVSEVLKEWSGFPNTAHDDTVDCMAYALELLCYRDGAVATKDKKWGELDHWFKPEKQNKDNIFGVGSIEGVFKW